MKTLFLLVFTLFFGTSFSQNFHLELGRKFSKENIITVLAITENTIQIKLYFKQSENCTCESEKLYTLEKDEYGEFSVITDKEHGMRISANVQNGKIDYLFVIPGDSENCCQIIPGAYVPKSK